MPVADYVEERKKQAAGSRGRTSRRVTTWDERLEFALDRATLSRLAYAGEATLGLDNFELKLTGEHLAVIKAALLRGTPEGR